MTRRRRNSILLALVLLLTASLGPAACKPDAAPPPAAPGPAGGALFSGTPGEAWHAQAPDAIAALQGAAGAGKTFTAGAWQRKGAALVAAAGGVQPAGGAAFAQDAGKGNATLVLKNESTTEACYVFISPVEDAAWGQDWLGAEETVPPGAQRSFGVRPGAYDLKAEDCAGEVIQEQRGTHISGLVNWILEDGAPPDESAPTREPAPDVPLSQYLCCGRTAGETRIWGISYPRGWEAELIPDNPDYFLGVLFSDPQSSMRVLIAPSTWTPMDTPMDTGDIDRYLDALTDARAEQSPGFQEFLRQPLQGLPGARAWAGTWTEGSRQYWESCSVMVTPMPYVAGMPRGVLMLMGLSAESSEWATVERIYGRMLDTIQVQVIHTGPAYEPPEAGPSTDPEEQEVGDAGGASPSFWELVFCARACRWEFIDIANQPAGSLWECSDGCIGRLSEVPCTEDQCR